MSKSSKPAQLEFVKSAVYPADYPPAKLPEVAVAGRSNAGKSSFFNALCGSAKMAKVSSTPGKTRLLNFFIVNKKYCMVDMPGYGFASRAGAEMRDWQKMIEDYLGTRENLRGLILVMDSRREWTEDEELLKQYLEPRGIPMIVVLTKADKLTKNEMNKALTLIKKQSTLSNVFMTSALEREGQDIVEDFIYKNWIKA
ncbi:MAG: ribosome biogenesis GTP-binding protein YihA/YsxC [Bdellovibrionia bacterium]